VIYWYILGHMTPRKKQPFFTKLDPELRAAMRRYKTAVGVPEAQQIERALMEWLGERPEAWPLPEQKGTTARKHKTARKKKAR
jgi:hypothetical protein